MSTGKTLQIESTSLDDTLRIGVQLGRRLRGGEVIELSSDLGGGKTSLVRGIAKGLGFTGTVRSPSFTIENQYQTPKLLVHHLDFYRLSEAGVVSEELSEALEEQDSVVIVEWSEIVQNVLPVERVKIAITVTGENTRSITVEIPDTFDYLKEGLA